MKRIVDYVLSIFYLIYFFTVLLIFEVLQRVSFTLFGREAHQKVVNVLNFFLCYGWYLTGSTINFEIEEQLPTDRSIIFVANHQSMFDIPAIIWFLRKHRPLFVSKVELSKGIPSISYNLRKGGAALIDRKDKVQAVKEIRRLGEYICEHHFSVAIFPEGTRSRTGGLKTFASGGVGTILSKCPEAIVVPICIQNLHHFNPKGFFPLRSFTTLKWTVLSPIDKEGKTVNEMVQEARDMIQKKGSFEKLP
ncbi:lysophospholipid acyltransferase family protein [Portibacter marinus]|uniref:lysophospholipid acyltransferase family protein n=1 Tax=Portibacter marinus TaxID=2898660 RepID=UPI001F158EFC|nr:lysophospholipid acyltransferase family protein [Portibacter marinus]